MEEEVHVNGKICDDAKRDLLFSDEDIERSLSRTCCRTKESYSCPHQTNCRDIFSRSEGPNALRRLRSLIWLKNPNGDQAPSLSQRRKNFVDLLKSMARTQLGRILFCFEGKMVCKSFFKVKMIYINMYVHYCTLLLYIYACIFDVHV